MTAPSPTRVLVWMCVLIAVNQLGFGSVVPVLALYARSFGVTQSAIGLAIAVYGLARFLVSMPVGRLTDVVGRRAALALGGLVTAAGNLRRRAELRGLRRGTVRRGRGRRARARRRPDRARRHHDPRAPRPRDGDLSRRVRLRCRHRPVAGRAAGAALRPGGAVR